MVIRSKNGCAIIKKFLLFVAGLFVGAILVGAFTGKGIIRKVHYTKAPLLLYSNATNSSQTMLPVGTAMYYDDSFDEGFSRYIVYINTKVDLDLPNAPAVKIDPLDGRPLRQETLLRALKEQPLTRQDLERILGSNRLSKDDVKEVLTNFLETEQ